VEEFYLKDESLKLTAVLVTVPIEMTVELRLPSLSSLLEDSGGDQGFCILAVFDSSIGFFWLMLLILNSRRLLIIIENVSKIIY
jgi:hypothetical protein